MTNAKDILGRLADAGEDAISRLSQAPGMGRVAAPMAQLGELLDDMQKRLLGLDAVEQRLAEIEQRLARIETQQAVASMGEPAAAPPAAPE